MTSFNRDRQTSIVPLFACFCFCVASLCLTGTSLCAQEDASVIDQLRRQIPSATSISRDLFENIARASEAPKREAFKNRSLTAELMFLSHKTVQGSGGQFRYLTESRMPKPTQFAQEMYRSIGKGRFRIVTHPVTMIQAERITKLEADVDGNRATGSFEFRVPELYEGKADFTAEKRGDDWTFTRFEMPNLKIDIRSDESGHWWRTDNLSGFELPKCLTGHTDTVWSLDFSKDGTQLVSGSSDHSVRIWDVDRREEVLTIPRAHKRSPAAPRIGGVLSVGFSPRENRVASFSDDGTVKIWNGETGDLEREIEVKNIVSEICFSPDGQSLLSSGSVLEVWNAKTGELEQTIRGHSFPSIAISPDGLRIVTAGPDPKRKDPDDNRRNLKLWDAKSGELLETSGDHHSALTTEIAFSPDEQRIASCSLDTTIKIWDAKNLEQLKSIEGGESLQSLSWSPDGRWIVSGDLSGAVNVWDSITGKKHVSLPKHPQGIRCVRYGPDGKSIATAGHDSVVRLWAFSGESAVR